MKRYDIFISYRRDDGGQYARILQLELEKLNYKVFLDYEELTDGIFGEEIVGAIQSARIFIMVLTPLYLARTMEDDSWVTKEIRLASEGGKHFIPVDPDRRFNGIPDNVPDDIKDIVVKHQHSSIDFGQALGATVDLMVKNRIIPHVPLPKPKKKLFLIVAVSVCLLAIIGIGAYFYHQNKIKKKIGALKAEIEAQSEPVENICRQTVSWSPDLTLSQAEAILSIMENMVEVRGGGFMQGAPQNDDGSFDEYWVCPEVEIPPFKQEVKTFFIGKYEVSVAEWCGIMGLKYDDSQADFPIADVSFEECCEFTDKLSDLTGLNFKLPTESEWEYAARGGIDPEGTVLSGGDEPDKVAWYAENSGKRAHVRNDVKGGHYCNSLDLYDMSGNVCEWCDTPFRPYNPDIPIPDSDAFAIRGGCFNSEPYELAVFHRYPMNPKAHSTSVGLRLVIRND